MSNSSEIIHEPQLDETEPDDESMPVELTVTVDVDVESTLDDVENVDRDDMRSTDADFGISGEGEELVKTTVSPRLLQHTHSLYHAARELEESKGRVRHEDDIWWDQRGNKPYQQYRGGLNKSLAHVTSKLHVPTAATIFWQREKANLEKIRPKPIPRLENPDAINPYINVKSKVNYKTAAMQRQEWNTWKEKLKEDEERIAAEIAAKNASKPKVKATSDRLLSVSDVKKAQKVHKEVDKREANWKRVPAHEPAWKETSPVPKLSTSVTSPDHGSESGSPGSKVGGGSSVSGTKTLKRSQSVERLYRAGSELPDYRQYVAPPRPKSPTPCAFGSGTPRATTPTEARRRSLTPNSAGGSTPGSIHGARRLSGAGSVSSYNSGYNGNGNSPANGGARSSRAAEARQRVATKDRSSPHTTPFEEVMRIHNLQITSHATPQPQSEPESQYRDQYQHELDTSLYASSVDLSRNDTDSFPEMGQNVANAIMQEHEMY